MQTKPVFEFLPALETNFRCKKKTNYQNARREQERNHEVKHLESSGSSARAFGVRSEFLKIFSKMFDEHWGGNDAMRRLIKIISVILIMFMILSVCIYRLRLGGPLISSHRAASVKGDLKIAEGAISSVDAANNVLLLSDGSSMVEFVFNDKTIFRSNNHIVQPAAISSGAKATVRYRKRGDRNLAQEILIASPNPY